MDITFNTQIVDVSVALNALKHYRAGEYKEAITHLVDILDVEPRNWDARLMLAACYYKTGQYATAQRAFRFLHDNSADAETKKKALEGLHACTVKLKPQTDLPPEFGGYVARNPMKQAISWLD
jgi:thioredoxin-like negative regulator of GroEL